MSGTISVEINDMPVEIESGSTLNDLFKQTQTSYVQGATIGIVKGGETKEEQTTEYSVRTNKGEFKIEVDSEKPELLNTFVSHFTGKQISAHWATPDAVAFGPIETHIKPDRGTYEYQRYDVIFGTGGYDAHNTYIIVAKGRHTASHGSPANGGVFARIISGKNIIAKLDKGDNITHIDPVIRWETLTDKVTTTDLTTPLEDGMANIEEGRYKNGEEVWTLRKRKPRKIISEKTNDAAWYPTYLVDRPGFKTERMGIAINHGLVKI